MSELVINCSVGHYNLGAHKLAEWRRAQGASVEYSEGDPGLFAGEPSKVWLSVIFSWHAPIAADIARRFSGRANIEAGGPGLFALTKWWTQETGLTCTGGLDKRFERQPGAFRMTFASRGCPVGCYFCIVPKLEGKTFTLDYSFNPAPILCDNNLSALPPDFQEFILTRYRATGTPLADCNSGFEPATFDASTYERWKPQLKGPWRFAFDTTDEAPQVEQMMQILSAESARKKQVYVLLGNEPMAQCLERARKVIEWGGEPYCQPMMPLNALRRSDRTIRYDWTDQKLSDVARYFNRHLWRSFPISEYKPRKHEPRLALALAL